MEINGGCTVLGIDFDGRSRESLDRVVREALSGTAFVRIATVNPEFLVRAHREPGFADTLRSADIRVADGSGIVLAGLLSGCGLSRYPGAELLPSVLAEAERLGVEVFVAAKAGGLSTYGDIRDALSAAYPKLRFDGADLDPASSGIPDALGNASVAVCGFGAPEQEYFLESLRNHPGNVRIAVGVGGAFDFMTGKRGRAPEWMRAVGVEWLFRLAIQPGRIRRVWDAVVIFPFLWLSDRMKRPRRKNGRNVENP